MQSLKTSVIALASAAFFASPVLAADLGSKDTAGADYQAPERFSFTGFFVGIQGGYGIANHTTNITSTEHFAEVPAIPSQCLGTLTKTHEGVDDKDTEEDTTDDSNVVVGTVLSFFKDNISEDECKEFTHSEKFGTSQISGGWLDGWTKTASYDEAVDAIAAHDVVTKSKFDSSDSGAVGGIVLGFDKQFGRLVAGVFGEYNWSDLEGHEGDWGIGGRLGYLIAPRLLAYGQVAYKGAEYEFADYQGWQFGGGLEYALTQNVFLGGKYTYASYDQETLVNTPDLVVKDDFDEHRIMVDLKLKLNGGLLGD